MLRHSCVLALSVGLALGQTPARPTWEPLFQELNQAQQQGKWQEAGRLTAEIWAAIRSAGPAAPNYANGVQMVVGAYQQQGFELKAEAVYQAAVTASSQAAPIRFTILQGLAQLYQMEQKPLRAMGTLREAIKAEEAIAGPESITLRNPVLQLASLNEEAGRLTEAETLFRLSETLTKASKAVQTQNAQNRFLIGNFERRGDFRGGPMEHTLAQFYLRHGRIPEAEQILRSALNTAEQAGPDNLVQFQSAAGGYVQFLQQQKRFAEAVELQSRIIRMQESSSDPNIRATSQYSRISLAETYLSAGNPEKANEIFQARIASIGNDQPQQQHDAVRQYAQALMREDKPAEAGKLLQDLLSEPTDNSPNAQWEVISARNQLAEAKERQGDKAAAAKLREQARQEQRSIQHDAMPEALDMEAAQQAMNQQKWEIVAQRAQETIARAAATGGFSGCYQAQYAGSLLTPMAVNKMMDKAEALGRQIVSICESRFGPDSTQGTEMGSQALLGIYQATQRWKEWEQLENHVMDVVSAAKGSDSPALVQQLQRFVNIYQSQQKHAAAEDALAKAVRIQESALGPDHPHLIWTLQEQAQVQAANGQWPNAERTWKRALAISETARGRLSADHVWLLSNVAQAYNQQKGFHDQAVALITQALELARQTPNPESIVPGIEQQRQSILAMNSDKPQQDEQSTPNGRWFNPSSGSRPVPAVKSH